MALQCVVRSADGPGSGTASVEDLSAACQRSTQSCRLVCRMFLPLHGNTTGKVSLCWEIIKESWLPTLQSRQAEIQQNTIDRLPVQKCQTLHALVRCETWMIAVVEPCAQKCDWWQRCRVAMWLDMQGACPLLDPKHNHSGLEPCGTYRFAVGVSVVARRAKDMQKRFVTFSIGFSREKVLKI